MPKASSSSMEASLDRIREASDSDDRALCVWDCGSPLYDLHELVSVSFIIERHLMLIPGAASSGDSKRFKAHLWGPIGSAVRAAVKVVGSEIIDGCGSGGGGGGGCGLMLGKKWKMLKGRGRCNKKVSYKMKSPFARLIGF